MVFESVVTNLMNKYLSQFVDELTAKQLNLGAWSGSLALSDIAVKANAFDSLSLPFRVIHGHIGRIEANIPWKSIYSSPVVVKLSDVYVVALPNTETKYNEETEALIELNNKKSQLDKIEEAKQRSQRSDDKSSGGDDGFAAKLAAQIIKNLHIEVNNVHICYEDRITTKGMPFQVGVTLKKLIFKTTNESNASQTNDNVIYKLVALEGFSIYWNCLNMKSLNGLSGDKIDKKLRHQIDSETESLQYVLSPINFNAKLVINRKPELNAFHSPTVDLKMDLNAFDIRMSRKQFESMLDLLDSIDRMNIAAMYRKWRPNVLIKGNAKLWWRFAYVAIVETDVKRRTRNWSWKAMKAHRIKMKLYQDLYKQKLMGKKVELESLERELNLFSIVLARGNAELEAQQYQLVNKEEKKGWFSGWWKKDDNKSEPTIVNDIKKEITPEEKAKLYSAIGYEEGIPPELPPDFVAHKILFIINKVNLSIYDDYVEVTQFSLKTVQLKVSHRPSSQGIKLSTCVKSISIAGIDGTPLLEEQTSTDVLSLKFDMNPLSHDYDYGVNLKMSGFKLIYDANTINKLAKILSPPKDVSLEELQSLATIQFQNLSNKTATGLEYAISKHKQLKLIVDIEPSYLIIPQLGQLSDAENILLVSLGHLNVSSNLIPKTERPKVREMFDSHSEHDLIVKMRKHAYESYNCCISDVQIILSDSNHWQKDMLESSTTRHLLYPVLLNITVDRCIITNDPHLAKLIVKGDLPNIEVKISDYQMSRLFNLLLTLPLSGGENQMSESLDEVDSFKRRLPRRALPIESNQVMVDAINYAKQTVSEIDERKQQKEKEDESNKQIIAYKNIIFEFKLKQILIALFGGTERIASCGLASAQLTKFELYGELLTDGTMWTSCVIGDLSLTDIRTSRSEHGIKTLFKKKIQNTAAMSTNSKSEKGAMFELTMTQKSDERFLEITLSGFQLIFALDYLLSLSNIITKSLEAPNADNESKDKEVVKRSEKVDQSKTESKSPQQPSSVSTIINFNLSQVDIVLLESIEVINAPAVVMSCQSSINVKQKTNFIQISCQVSDISMFLTNYERYTLSNDIDAFIMRPTDLSVNGTMKGEHQMLDISFTDIRIFISPPMVNIILNILSKMGSSAEKEREDSRKIFCNSDLFKPKPNDANSWYLSYVVDAEEATEEFVKIISSKDASLVKVSDEQQVFLNFQSITITIESGGSDSQPLIKLESYFTGKFVGYKLLSLNCSLISDYYNENNTSWEPLIEPIEGKSTHWDFNIDINLNDNGKTNVKFESNEQLELTITKTSFGVLTSLNEAFANAVTKQSITRDENLVIIKNTLGIDLNLVLTNNALHVKSDNVYESNGLKKIKVSEIRAENLIIKSGHEVPLYTTDLKVVDLIISLKLDANTEVNRHIKCSRNKIRCYNLPKRTYPTDTYWKFIVEVEDIDAYTKSITFKSIAEIVNKFNSTLDIYQFNVSTNEAQFIDSVKPLSALTLPLDFVYSENSILKIKPSNSFELSNQCFDWRNYEQQTDRTSKRCLSLPLCDFSPSKKSVILECVSNEASKTKFYVKVKDFTKVVHFEETDAVHNDSIVHHITLMPIAKLRNLLPFDVCYSIDECEQSIVILSGEDNDLANVKLGETGLLMKLTKYNNRDWICSKRIPANGSENEVLFWTFTSIGEGIQLSIDLAVNLSIENSLLVVSLFSPFWMINRTEQHLIYRIDDETVINHPPSVAAPVLLSFKPKSFFCKKKLTIAIGDSRFSDGFSIDVVGSRGNIIAKSKNGKYHYCVSLEITLSRIGLTKIVTLTPFYSIINVSLKNIQISEDNDEWTSVSSLTNKPFWPKKNKKPIIYFRLSADAVSSKALSLCDSSSTLIQVENDYIYVDVDITEWDATIKLSDYFEGSAPVMLVNALNKPLTYGQKDIAHMMNLLPPFHSVLYTWYDPTTSRVLTWKYDTIEEQRNELKCDSIDTVNDIVVVSFLDAKQRVLLFTNDLLLATNALQAGEITQPKINIEFIMKGIGLSIVNNEANKDILYIAITSSVIWEFCEANTKRFKAVSAKSNDVLESSYQKVMLDSRIGGNKTIISQEAYQIDFTDSKSPKLIAPKPGNLRRLSNRGIWVSLAMSEHIVQCHMKIHRLQIDNQMPDCMFGIVMCPIAPPKSVAANQMPKSFIELSTVIHRQATFNRFKTASILIQEFLIQLDMGLLVTVQEFLSVVNIKKINNRELIAKDLKNIIKDNKVSENLQASRKTYYDLLHFSPLKVHLSFSLSGSSGGTFPFGLDFFVRSAGVTLTEFNDVLFKLDYFERKNILVDNSELISVLTQHYSTQVLKQFYVLVLGLDVLGNPMKLVLGLQQGVGDFFYEPFQGIIQGPEEFAEGIALGVKSLTSNVLGGVSGALGSITGTLGEGVSALTLDDKFRRERRSRLNKKGGFAESGKNLFRGVFAGVTGVITQPLEGAKEDGFEGLMKGVGRGVVGIVAQPTTGVIDFASGSLNAFKRVIDPKQEAKQMRPPRQFTHDHILRAYNRHYATGFSIVRELESGKYASDVYINHCALSPNTMILLTDKRLLSLKKALITHNWECDWCEEWTNCKNATLTPDLKIKITLKEQRKKFGLFSGDSERVITTNSADTSQRLIELISKTMEH